MTVPMTIFGALVPAGAIAARIAGMRMSMGMDMAVAVAVAVAV